MSAKSEELPYKYGPDRNKRLLLHVKLLHDDHFVNGPYLYGNSSDFALMIGSLLSSPIPKINNKLNSYCDIISP
jgi:hypothetical protein